ncbi:type IV toxin-antitoxin system AbiEi family antitoxin domain-containing protein [Microbacterium lacticum]
MAAITIAKLGAIAAERWGMVTTAQASEVGVSRKTLSALTVSGALERLAQGVYRMAGAPVAMLEIDTIRVHWVALGGTKSLVAAGKSAATLHEIGDWFPGASEFVSPARRTTRIDGVRIRIRSLEAADTVFVDGMPTMTVERTIADLVESREDLSLVSGALRDAAMAGKLTAPRRLGRLLQPFARRNGALNGEDLAERLMHIGGISRD